MRRPNAAASTPGSDPEAPPGLPRRGFLTRLGLGVLGALTAGRAAAPGPLGAQAAPAQDAWLEGLTGKHRQIFDASALSGGRPLVQARNFMNAYGEAYGLEDADVNAVIAVHGETVPLVFRDAVWERFSLGERYRMQDPRTKAPARRNVYFPAVPGSAVDADASVEALQARGVVFLLCNNSLKRFTGQLSQAGFGTPEAVREELLAGLLPGVVVVPAAVVAMNLAQERGVTYVHTG